MGVRICLLFYLECHINSLFVEGRIMQIKWIDGFEIKVISDLGTLLSFQ